MRKLRKISAATPLNLKKALRKMMGLPDQRTWTTKEWELAHRLFEFEIDYPTNKFVARPRVRDQYHERMNDEQ